jgi:DNA-binding beta-propeller fold protein YncE
MTVARLFGLLVWITLAAAAAEAGAAPSSAPNFSVEKRWAVGGDGGWDYLTVGETGSRLFVSRGTRVDVINTSSGSIIGSILNTAGVHGIAIAPELERGFTSNGRADSVTAFDLKTLAVIQEAQVPGHNPDAILYDPATKHVLTFNGKSKDVTVLDALKLNVVATIPVPDKPEFAVEDDAGSIFGNIESDPGQMVVIDSRKLKVRAVWPLAGCSSPTGLAIDREHHRLFSVCDDKVMVVTDSVSGKQVARVPIGDGPDAAAYDASRGLIFSSNGEGNLTVVRQVTADRYEVAETVPTERGARTMALDAARGKVYLVTARLGPPPAPTPEHAHPRGMPLPGSFTVLVVGTSAGAGMRHGN